MPLSQTIAIVTLEGLSPYSQSRKHEEPMLEGELPDAYDKRTWRSHLHISGSPPTVHITTAALHKTLCEAGAYTSEKIKGQGTKTWTAKFRAGLAIFADADLRIKPEDVTYDDLYCNADGKPGGGKRVMRRFPIIPTHWRTTFEVRILDPVITREVFEQMVENAGLFVGIGRWRPAKGGSNGRFQITNLQWNLVPRNKVIYAKEDPVPGIVRAA